MNNKININPSSTKWLEKDDRASLITFVTWASVP